MGERAGVLRELARAERPHVLDPLHRLATLLGGECLIAEDRQPLLETELEPVAAGYPIAGPVVEVFVGDDALDALVVGVCRGRGIGQQQ